MPEDLQADWRLFGDATAVQIFGVLTPQMATFGDGLKEDLRWAKCILNANPLLASCSESSLHDAAWSSQRGR